MVKDVERSIDHVTALDRIVQADQTFHAARGAGPVVRRQLDERKFVLEFDFLDQVRHEHERTVENAQEQRGLLAGIVGIDSLRHGIHGLVDLLGGDHDSELLVVKLYGILHFVTGFLGLYLQK